MPLMRRFIRGSRRWWMQDKTLSGLKLARLCVGRGREPIRATTLVFRSSSLFPQAPADASTRRYTKTGGQVSAKVRPLLEEFLLCN